MTTQKSFKRRVRDRMAKTGESYTAARRQLVPADAAPVLTDDQRALLMHGEDAVTSATGHGWEHWIAVLDDWSATEHTHTEIARYLVDDHQVPGWWAQGVTVSYERVRGMRAVGETAGGFEANATKTIAADADRVFEAITDDALRQQWLPGADLRERTATRPKSARYDWLGAPDGSRVIVGISTMAAGKVVVAIQHERLPDAESVAELKGFWRAGLSRLKDSVEAPASAVP